MACFGESHSGCVYECDCGGFLTNDFLLFFFFSPPRISKIRLACDFDVWSLNRLTFTIRLAAILSMRPAFWISVGVRRRMKACDLGNVNILRETRWVSSLLCLEVYAERKYGDPSLSFFIGVC